MDYVLLTGGAGFIGSHIARELRRNGRPFLVIDNLCRGNRNAIHPDELLEGDLLDSDFLNRVFETYPISDVIHLAAFAYVRESIEQPGMYWKNNVGGTLNLLETMKHHAVERILFSSSCATYGKPQSIPIPLNAPQAPINPYGWTKLVCEKMISDYASQYSWKYALLRYFNVAGSDPSGEIGETHEPETHIIPSVLLGALGGESHVVPIYGDQYPTPDGSCVRDFIHVCDLAAIHHQALHFLQSGGESSPFICGTGRGFSVLEIVEMCRKATGRPISIKIEEPNPGDPPVLVADAAESMQALNYTCRHSDLEDMITHTWNWLKKSRK